MKWTDAEKMQLQQIMTGSFEAKVDWKKIAAQFENKTPKQCYDCWTLLQKPSGLQREYRRWSRDEEHKFIEFVKRNGPNWGLLQATVFPDRSISQIKNKYKQDIKNRMTRSHEESSSQSFRTPQDDKQEIVSFLENLLRM